MPAVDPSQCYRGKSAANTKLAVTISASGDAAKSRAVYGFQGGYLDANGVGQLRLFKKRGITACSGVNVTIADTNPDTIVRASGSFVTDGWQAGDVAIIAGSAQAANNGVPFVVATVAALTLTLETVEAVTAVGAAAGVTVTCFRPVEVLPVLAQGWRVDDVVHVSGWNAAMYLVLDAGGGTAVGYAEARTALVKER